MLQSKQKTQAIEVGSQIYDCQQIRLNVFSIVTDYNWKLLIEMNKPTQCMKNVFTPIFSLESYENQNKAFSESFAYLPSQMANQPLQFDSLSGPWNTG